jgi:glyceraldehyde 3-phosphate dehydrogenase
MAARPGEFEVVAINDLASAADMAYLLRYDTVHRGYPGNIDIKGEGAIVVDGREIEVLTERDPSKLAWGDRGIKIVLESTGVFTGRAKDGKPGYDTHLAAGAERVVLSAPAKDEVDLTLVMGVNDSMLSAEHRCISNASCTTNCLAPLVKVLHDTFGLQEGLMTTVHAYTNDQQILDLVHKDLRRARAAAQNVIPTTTGAARAVGKVIPELNGKLDGMAMRVPVQDGSVVDLTATLGRSVTAAQINEAVREAAEGPLQGILQYVDDPIVSSDIIGNPHSSIFDSLLTATMPKEGGEMVKVISWYDNEWGFSNRTADLITRLGSL